jgi:ABC-2 type transport system permease protein
MTYVTDILIQFRREIAPLLRSWYYVLFGLLQPLLYLVLFVPLLGDVPSASGDSPIQWFVPGMIVMLTLFTTATCGWALTEELMSGSFERFLATPMSRSAQLVGRTLKEMVPLLLQAALLLVAAVPFGLALHVTAILLGLALVIAFGIGVASLSYALALATRKDSGGVFYMITHGITLPLMLLGGVLLPMEMAPRWLYAASRVNPLTYLVEAERALFTGQIASLTVLYGAAMSAGVAVIGIWVGTRTITRVTL